MKKDLIKSIKIIIIGLLLSVGVSYVSSSTFWNNATGTAPSGNLKEVVNTSDHEQVKLGSLFIENGGSGKLSADELFVNHGSYFGSKVDIGKKFVGGVGGFGTPASTLDTDLSVTGKIGVNLDEAGLIPTAGIHVDGSMKLRPLKESSNPGIAYNAKICADELGTLMLCDAPFAISWNVTSVEQPGNAECYSDKKTMTVLPTAGEEPYTASWSFSAAGAEDPITVTGSGLTRTVTFWKNENTSYTATITVTVDDSSPDVDPFTTTYTQNVPKQPETLGGEALCPE